MSAPDEPRRPTPLDVPPRRLVLPDDALVIRGGRCNHDDLVQAALLCHVKHGRAGISVWAAEVPTYGDLLKQTPIPHPDISCSTAGRIREVGLDLSPTGGHGHHTVWLPGDFTDSAPLADAIARFASAMDPFVSRHSL